MGSCASMADKGADAVQASADHRSIVAWTLQKPSSIEKGSPNINTDEDQASPLTSPTLVGSPLYTTSSFTLSSPTINNPNSFSSRHVRRVDFEPTAVRMGNAGVVRHGAILPSASPVPNDSLSSTVPSSTYRSMDEQLVAHGEAVFVPIDFGCCHQSSSTSLRKRALFSSLRAL